MALRINADSGQALQPVPPPLPPAPPGSNYDIDGDGRMDDLNHDGRVNIADAKVIQDAVNRVERAHPSLIGGCGIYSGTSAHGPFTHIDTRGYPARWIGTGDS